MTNFLKKCFRHFVRPHASRRRSVPRHTDARTTSKRKMAAEHKRRRASRLLVSSSDREIERETESYSFVTESDGPSERHTQVNGFEALSVGPALRLVMARILDAARGMPHDLHGFRDGRNACNVHRLLGFELQRDLLDALRSDANVRHALLARLGHGVALAGIQHIVCPPHAPRQQLHKDSLGASLAASLAVSLSPSALQTWFLPGSHAREFRDEEYDAISDADLRQPLSHAVLYDSAIVHGGGATGAVPDDARLFFLFVDSFAPVSALRSVLRRNSLCWKRAKHLSTFRLVQ